MKSDCRIIADWFGLVAESAKCLIKPIRRDILSFRDNFIALTTNYFRMFKKKNKTDKCR